MALVHQHEVVLLKAVDGYGLDPPLLLQLVHIHHNHIAPPGGKAALLFEYNCGNGGQRQLLQMLPAHALVGGQHDDLIDG